MPSEGTRIHAELLSPLHPQRTGCSWTTETFPLAGVGQPPAAPQTLAVTVSDTVSEISRQQQRACAQSDMLFHLGHKVVLFVLHQDGLTLFFNKKETRQVNCVKKKGNYVNYN